MTYKVIIRNMEEGTEKYINDLSKAKATEEAAKQAEDKSKHIYVEWTDVKGNSGYLNRDGSGIDCPGEPW